jgi:hypothetical protein
MGVYYDKNVTGAYRLQRIYQIICRLLISAPEEPGNVKYA